MDTVITLNYGRTNTYLIKGKNGCILFDTDWAGTFPQFQKALSKTGIQASEVKFLFISHFHPDHMGIAQEIADTGTKITVLDVQKNDIHKSDGIFAKEKKPRFVPIRDEEIQVISCQESRHFLDKLGISGEIFHTPGHTDDSISLYLDEGALLVGDLNPLYELEAHKGTKIYDSWELLLERKPKCVYYGHAKPAVLDGDSVSGSGLSVSGGGSAGSSGFSVSNGVSSDSSGFSASDSGFAPGGGSAANSTDGQFYALVAQIMKYIDKGYSVEKIRKKTSADKEFIEDVMRMYLTHQNIGVQGIIDRIEIKGK